MNIAIITARGGSKRIPRKNIKKFLGKPIIAYSIETALASNCFDKVMVSTDDEEIAQIAKKYGAEVPFLRSINNSDDFATTADVVLEVIDSYENVGSNIDIFCCFYPTAPLVDCETLIKAFNTFKEHNCNAIVPVVSFGFSPYRGNIIDEQGNLKYKWPNNRVKRSQDLEPLYHDAGQFYFGKSEVIKLERTLVPTETKPIILSELQVQDIDTETDWKIAELKYKLLTEGY